MLIPQVIDNQTYSMKEVLAGLLREHEGRCLDIATAYFNVGGFELIKEGLPSRKVLDILCRSSRKA